MADLMDNIIRNNIESYRHQAVRESGTGNRRRRGSEWSRGRRRMPQCQK